MITGKGSVALLVLGLALALPRPATAWPRPVYGPAVVDGHFDEWQPHPLPIFALMVTDDWPGRRVLVGYVFLRYSCSTQTLYVMGVSGYTIQYGPDHPVRGGVDGVERYFDTSGNDGIPPDFARGETTSFPFGAGWISGYEASFQVAPGSHTFETHFSVHLDDFDGTHSASTDGAPAAPLQIDCATAVSVGGFAATRAASGVTLSWTTGSEVGIAGFNVWRSPRADDGFTRLNGALINAKNPAGLAGAAYSFNDESAESGGPYFYRLEVIGTDGRSRTLNLSSRDDRP